VHEGGIVHSVFLLIPKSDECRTWVDDNVAYDFGLGNGIPVEHRFIGGIVEGLIADGFEYGQDFEVTA
jgi:hypothetical protein